VGGPTEDLTGELSNNDVNNFHWTRERKRERKIINKHEE